MTECSPSAAISHLALVENADAFLIAPATANTIAALAVGATPSLLASAYLAADCPVLLAPAMNHRMWHHPATVRNVARLREDGVEIVPPGSGRLASLGEHGDGRLAEPDELLAAIERVLGTAGPTDRDLVGLHVLISAGGTREPIDAVRFVGATRDADVTTARFAVAGTTYAVRVRSRRDEAARLTCQALRDNPVPVHDLLDVTTSS